MKVLFVHQNFPGQYLNLAKELIRRGDEVVAVGGPTSTNLPGVQLLKYDPLPKGGIPRCHEWANDFQTKCLRAQAVGQLINQYIKESSAPDLVIGHPGWGELVAAKDILPKTPVIHQVEFIYNMEGADLDFDPEFNLGSWHQKTSIRLKRALQLMSFHDLDWGLSPTQWQASTAPKEFHDRISIIHEGIDTNNIRRIRNAVISLKKAGICFKRGDKLVTYAARNLEPYRGFHVFMRMLPRLQSLQPNAQVIIVGGNGIGYGAMPTNHTSWREAMVSELSDSIDWKRVHFVGHVPHHTLHQLFSITACHVYLTYPFVLSWSLLEAMSCESPIVASSTPPVEEVITNNANGVLTNFFDIDEMANQISMLIDSDDKRTYLGKNARAKVMQSYDRNSICMPRQLKLVDRISGLK